MQSDRGRQCAKFGDFELDFRAGQLRKHGKRIRLPDQSIKVLCLLLENPGGMVSREQLCERLWPNGTVVEFDQGVNAAIKRLRAALFDSAENPRYIETLPKRGYRFIAPFELLERPGAIGAEPALPETADHLAGRQFAQYRVLDKIGQGGMAVVYRGVDSRLGRPVALKFLAAEFLSDASLRDQFKHEARLASAVNHANICTIYDVGEDSEQPYIAMELLEGETLEQVLSRGPLPVIKVLDYAQQIAAALSAAHARGIIHRDVKPGNIFITSVGLAKVTDFGIAKRQTATTDGGGAGTLRYAAPEQLEGHNSDERSDVFSLGAVIDEMATGHPPSHDRECCSPCEIACIVERCMQIDPRGRYGSMEELQDDLERANQAMGATRWARVRQWLSAPAIGIVILVGSVIWLTRAKDPGKPTVPVPLTSYVGDEVSPSFSPDGNQVAFAWNPSENVGESNFNIYVKQIGGGDPVRITHYNADEFSPAWSPDGRNIAFLRRLSPLASGVYLIPATGGVESKLTEIYQDNEYRAYSWNICWYPDGSRLLLSDKESTSAPFALFWVSTLTGEKQRLTSPPPGSIGDESPAISPDGRAVVFTRGTDGDTNGLYLMELSSSAASLSAPRQVTFETIGADPAWMPDGRAIIFVAGPIHTSSLWKLKFSEPGRKPQQSERLLFAGESAGEPAISRQGRLAYRHMVENTDIWRMDLKNLRTAGRPLQGFITSTRLDDEPRYSPDGTRIAFASDRSGTSEIWVCKSDGSGTVQLTNFGIPNHTAHPRWSPDGRFIAFTSTAGRKANVYVIPSEGGKPTRLALAGFLTWSLSEWSRNGKWIYFGSNRSGDDQLWKAPWPETAGAGSAVQITKGGFTRDATESPDGRSLYYLKGTGLTHESLWRLPVEGGEEVQVLKSVLNNNFAITRDGIYFIPDARPPSIRFSSFSSGRELLIAKLPRLPAWGFCISPDSRWLLYSEWEATRADLMLVDAPR